MMPFNEPVTTICDHDIFARNVLKNGLKGISRVQPVVLQSLYVKQLTPVKTRLILNMLDSLSIQCQRCSRTGLQRGNFRRSFEEMSRKKTPTCSCSAADIRCLWSGSKNELSSHLEQCPYEQLRPILTELLDENRQLKQRMNERESSTSAKNKNF